MATNTTTIKFVGQFDSSGIVQGLQNIKKQMSSSHIGEDLRKQIEGQLSKVEANIPALEKMASKGEYNSKDLQAFQKVVQQVSKDMLALDELVSKADFTKVFSEADTAKVKQFEKQLTDVENKLKNTRQEIIKAFSNTDAGKVNGKSNATLNGVIDQILSVSPDQMQDKLNEIISDASKQMENAQEQLANIFSHSNKVKTVENMTDILWGKSSGVTVKHGEAERLKTAFNEIRAAVLEFNETTSSTEVETQIKKLIELINDPAFENTKGKESVFKNFFPPEVLDKLKEYAGNFDEFKKLLGPDGLKLLADGEAEKLNISSQYAQFLSDRLQDLGDKGILTKEQIAAVSKALGIMNSEIEEGSQHIERERTQMDALKATFGSLTNRITNSISALTIFNKSIQIIHKAIASVKELDAAFTQIAIVSEQSNEQAWKMFDSFNKLAKQYSITTKDLTEGAKLFYQQGLNAADTMKMVEASTISAALGEVTMTEAANTLTAAIQGYNESAAVAMDYTDKIAMVGAVSAADFNELSAAMEKTASSAYTAGIDFDHLLGFLGRMIEVTREAPANLGTAMKTIIARFEDMKKDPNALIDGASANKVEAALATIGIALRDTAGEFRPLQDVFVELGKKWDSLTRNQQAYIATVAAGSRQQSRFLAMMNDFDRTMELVEESQNSAGAAAKQYAIYQDSAAAATARLTAAWEEFYTKIINSEQIIWVLDRLKDLVEVMTKVGPIVSAIGASLAALGAQAIIKGLSGGIGKTLAEVASTGKMATISLAGLGKGALALVISLGKVLGAIILVASALWAGVRAWQAWNKHINPDKYEIKELTEDIRDLNESISESSERVKSLEDLMKRYDELSRKIYRTKEEQEELNNTINEINSVSKRAIVITDKNGEAHLHNAESVKAEIEAEKELIKSKSDKKYEKTQKLLSKDSLTAEQAREVGLEEYADALEKTTNDNIKRYNKLNDIRNKEYERSLFKGGSGKQRLNELNNSDLINKRFEELTSNNEFSEYLTELGYGNFGEIKSISDLKTNAHKFGYSDMDQNYQKAAEMIYDFMIKEFDENFQEALKIINDSDTLEKEKESQKNNTLQQYFSELSEYDESASAFFNLMSDGLKFSGDQLNEVKKSYENYYNDNKEAIDEYLASNRNLQDIDKLLDKIGDSEDAITEGLINYSDEVKKQISSNNIINMQRRMQFVNDYAYLSSGDTRAAIISGSITENEQAKMEDIAKSTEFSQPDKDIFYKIFAGNNTILDKYIDDYVKNLENGFYKKADDIKQLIINLLTQEGISLEAAEKLTNFFVPDLNSVLESRLTKFKDDYKSAKDIYKKDSAEALTDKEYEFLQGQDINIDRYININEEGEKYLSILGKINLLENARANYINNTNEQIKKNVDDIARSRIEIAKANQELETGIDLTSDGNKLNEDQLDARKALIKTNEQLITNLKQENDILSEQLQIEIDISNQAANMALTENISQAKKYSDNIEKIGEAYGKAQQNAMHLEMDTALSLLAMDDSYHKYIDIVDGMVTVNAEGMEAMRDNEAKKYNDWLTEQKNQLKVEKILLSQQLQTINLYLDEQNEDKKAELKEELKNHQIKINEELKKQKEGGDKTEVQNQDMLIDLKAQYEEYYKQLFAADDAWKAKMTSLSTDVSEEYFAKLQAELGKNLPTATVHQQSIEIGDVDFNLEGKALDTALEEEKAQIEKRLGIIEITLEQLDNLSVNFNDSFKKGIEGATKSSGKADDKLKNLEKTIKELNDALKDLDDLLIEVNRDLRDIDVDYSPFMELFEAWEHEWDYYYNIKNLITQLGKQGEYIDNIISSEYTSATEKLAAYDAKIGNITSKMAANDAYMTTLRAGIAQQALKLEKEFGKYYNVDNVMGNWQIFQKDTTLTEWNQVHDSIAKASYELSKLINHQENELNLLEATQDALDQERSAYESILSTVDSVISSLEDNEEISVDLSGLKDLKAELELSIKNESVEEIKSEIRALNDYMQELEWQLDLNDNVVLDGIDKAFDRMEDGIDHVQELIDALNDTISEQQQLLQEVSEIYNYYVETAISTEQELYNAIVENYQNEINEKKKQYDYLKQLDNDYLNSIKKNISDERKAREDANKQKSYQQNLQRAQLLQMDTSGAYRGELANLNKELENQRQDLYDDLVDKQVDALEKEIQKRHELYDMEVAALEERLAYYQENAIILWEMVNQIVAEGSESMMATLENTIDYINSNELAKEQQRRQWELSIQTTFKGVVNGEIENLKTRIEKGNEYIKSIEEIKAAINKNTEVYQQSTTLLTDENANFQSVMDAYMQTWTDMTNGLTGYYTDWQATVAAVKDAMEIDIAKLRALGENGGGIQELEETLRKSAKDMYDSFIEERRSYKDQLEGIIEDIRVRITAAITDAANAIRNAVNGVSDNPNGGSSRASIGSGGSYASGGGIGSGTGGSGSKSESGWKWRAWASYYDLQSNPHVDEVVGDYDTQQEALAAIENLKRKWRTSWVGSSVAQVWNKYAKGGFVNYTGPAWLDGTPSKPEAVLNPKQTRLFETMVSSLERTANNSNVNSPLGSSYNIGDINTSIQVAKLDDQTDIDKLARKVEDKIIKTIRNRVVVSM